MNSQPPTTETTRKKRQVQPRHHAPKTKAASALRRKKIIKAFVEGRNLKEAAIATGLSPKTAAQQVSAILKEPEVQRTLQATMEAIGINDNYLAEHLRMLIDSKKVIRANIIASGGVADLKDAGSAIKGYVAIPDYMAMARGLDLVCRLRGLYKDRTRVDIKPPVTVVIRKFCSRGNPPTEGATA